MNITTFPYEPITIFVSIGVNKRRTLDKLLCQVCRALKFNGHIFIAYFAKWLRLTIRSVFKQGVAKSTKYRKHLLTQWIL